MAMMRDQAFGSKSEQVVEGTSINDLNKSSLETYRNHIRNANQEPAISFSEYYKEIIK